MKYVDGYISEPYNLLYFWIMNILVLGAGTFGTAIANELSVNTENKVVLFSRNQ